MSVGAEAKDIPVVVAAAAAAPLIALAADHVTKRPPFVHQVDLIVGQRANGVAPRLGACVTPFGDNLCLILEKEKT